jgi:hypothetical protein
MVKTQSAFQPHDSTIFPVYNPLPGPWFAIAYLSPFEEKITQQGNPCSWLSVRAVDPDSFESGSGSSISSESVSDPDLGF